MEKEEKDFPGGSQPYTKASKPYNPLSPVSSKGLLLAATSGKKPAGPVPLPVTSPASVPASVSLVSANPQPSQQPKPPAAVV
ncbi:MAG: hypothetical protein EBX50_19625 [Chitinophagia bacterium]|nr:hypothetical protein [Chitinophagia bacterium]